VPNGAACDFELVRAVENRLLDASLDVRCNKPILPEREAAASGNSTLAVPKPNSFLGRHVSGWMRRIENGQYHAIFLAFARAPNHYVRHGKATTEQTTSQAHQSDAPARQIREHLSWATD
jgi:hypothetical protein